VLWLLPTATLFKRARSRTGIERGDLVVAESNDILVQTGSFYGVEDDDLSFTKLMQHGHITVGRGAYTAIDTPVGVRPQGHRQTC
jgi:hypothetical protein